MSHDQQNSRNCLDVRALEELSRPCNLSTGSPGVLDYELIWILKKMATKECASITAEDAVLIVAAEKKAL